jgi:hypothetical protein
MLHIQHSPHPASVHVGLQLPLLGLRLIPPFRDRPAAFAPLNCTHSTSHLPSHLCSALWWEPLANHRTLTTIALSRPADIGRRPLRLLGRLHKPGVTDSNSCTKRAQHTRNRPPSRFSLLKHVCQLHAQLPPPARGCVWDCIQRSSHHPQRGDRVLVNNTGLCSKRHEAFENYVSTARPNLALAGPSCH